MGQFVPGRDTEVTFEGDPTLEVLVDRANPLKVGKHVFRLVVTDTAGNRSEPAIATIIVVDRDRPTAVLDVLDAAGRALVPPFTLGFGDKFVLSGKGSADIGGDVRSWTWTLVPAIGPLPGPLPIEPIPSPIRPPIV